MDSPVPEAGLSRLQRCSRRVSAPPQKPMRALPLEVPEKAGGELCARESVAGNPPRIVQTPQLFLQKLFPQAGRKSYTFCKEKKTNSKIDLCE